jgi:glucokinase
VKEQYVLGIDIGGTTTKLALVRAADDSHGILGQTAIETQPADTAPNFVLRIAEAARLLIAAAPQPAVGVGVGCPGLIDHRRGIVTLCTNIPHLTQFPLRDELSKALKLPVEMQNDANTSAVGEFLFGEGRGTSNLIVLMLGTGVGGGIVCDGHLLCGADNAAAELGHVKVEFGSDATPCACGRAGCLEAYVGIAGIQRIAQRHLLHASNEKPTSLKPDDLSTKQIADAARCGDEIAKAILHETGTWLGRGIANLIETFNPEKIVIAGGASAALDVLLPGINESLDRYCCFPMTRQRAVITRSAIPDTVPFLGPAAVFLIAHNNRA